MGGGGRIGGRPAWDAVEEQGDVHECMQYAHQHVSPCIHNVPRMLVHLRRYVSLITEMYSMVVETIACQVTPIFNRAG